MHCTSHMMASPSWNNWILDLTFFCFSIEFGLQMCKSKHGTYVRRNAQGEPSYNGYHILDITDLVPQPHIHPRSIGSSEEIDGTDVRTSTTNNICQMQKIGSAISLTTVNPNKQIMTATKVSCNGYVVAIALILIAVLHPVDGFAVFVPHSNHQRQSESTITLFAKRVSFKEDARRGLVSGINQVADAVRVTLGPKVNIRLFSCSSHCCCQNATITSISSKFLLSIRHM